MSEVMVNADALNALCEAANGDMRFRNLVGAVRASVKATPKRRSASRPAPEPAIVANETPAVES